MTRRFLFVLVLSLSGMLPVATAAAEVLPDPTRPPASIATPASPTLEARRRPVLQSIIITPHGRAAIIDDERVELHGRFRDAEVAQITETEVVLRSKAGIETLRMYPGVEKVGRGGRR